MGQHERCRKHRDCRKTTKVCKDKCQPITKHDFGYRRDETYVISKPGYYCLKDDICFKPESKNTHAILIDSDDVVLDLCGHVLKQVNQTTSIIGVYLKTGHRNVTLLGSYGAIRDFSQLGVYIEGGNTDVTIGDPDTTLDINGCGGATPRAFNDEGVAQFQGGMAVGENEYHAIQGYPSVKGLVEIFSLERVNLDRNKAFAIWIGNGKDFLFRDSSFSFNTETRLLGSNLVGPDRPNINSIDKTVAMEVIYLENAQVNGPDFPGDTGVIGFRLENCVVNCNSAITELEDKTAILDGLYCGSAYKDLKITNCTFSENLTSTVNDTSRCRGCTISGGESVVIENSEACGNVAESSNDTQVDGFHDSGFQPGAAGGDYDTAVSTLSVVYKNCLASNNLGKLNNEGFGFGAINGFISVFARGSSFIDCTAENNTIELGEPENAAVFTYGLELIGASPAQLETLVKGCKFSRNRTSSTFFGDSGGIDTFVSDLTNLTIQDCVITSNSVNGDPGTRFDYGIGIFGPSLVCVKNCIITGHTNNQAGPHAVGIYAGTEQSTFINNTFVDNDYAVILDGGCNVVKNNLLSNGKIGLLDFTSPSQNLIAQNKAFNNPNGSYLVDWGFSAPVVTGTLGVDYPTGAQVCDNVDIIKDVERTLTEDSSELKVKIDSLIDRRKQILEKSLIIPN